MSKILTPIKSIRAKCLDCCCGQQIEVRLCSSEKCPLYPYRMGHRPKDREILDEEKKTEKCLESPTENSESEAVNDDE